jgi:hypothetical protein
MSLWLDAMLSHLNVGAYHDIRVKVLPLCPIPLPDCLMKEFEYGERCCNNSENDRLFPIRFLWFMEAHEQRMFGYQAGARSRYHPEKLLEFWERANSDSSFLQEQTANGFRFDMKEKAINMSSGWIYIGDDLVGDLMVIEKTLKVEMIFTNYPDRPPQPAFSAIKQLRASGESNS